MRARALRDFRYRGKLIKAGRIFHPRPNHLAVSLERLILMGWIEEVSRPPKPKDGDS